VSVGQKRPSRNLISSPYGIINDDDNNDEEDHLPCGLEREYDEVRGESVFTKSEG